MSNQYDTIPNLEPGSTWGGKEGKACICIATWAWSNPSDEVKFSQSWIS